MRCRVVRRRCRLFWWGGLRSKTESQIRGPSRVRPGRRFGGDPRSPEIRIPGFLKFRKTGYSETRIPVLRRRFVGRGRQLFGAAFPDFAVGPLAACLGRKIGSEFRGSGRAGWGQGSGQSAHPLSDFGSCGQCAVSTETYGEYGNSESGVSAVICRRGPKTFRRRRLFRREPRPQTGRDFRAVGGSARGEVSLGSCPRVGCFRADPRKFATFPENSGTLGIQILG